MKRKKNKTDVPESVSERNTDQIPAEETETSVPSDVESEEAATIEDAASAAGECGEEVSDADETEDLPQGGEGSDGTESTAGKTDAETGAVVAPGEAPAERDLSMQESLRLYQLFSSTSSEPEKTGKTKKYQMPGGLRALLIVLAVIAVMAATGFGIFLHLYAKLQRANEEDLALRDAAIESWKAAGIDMSDYDDDDESDPMAPVQEAPAVPLDQYLTVAMEEGPDSAALYARAEELAEEAEARQREADELRDQAEAMERRAEERVAYEIELEIQEEERIKDSIRTAMEADGGTPITDSKVMNIMLIGIDTRSDGTIYSRSDTMILLSVNHESRKIILTSFMRDSYVYYKSTNSYNRLNAAGVIGGPSYVCDMIGNVFGVKVSDYALVNFFSFIDVVDAMGGIDIEVREEEISHLNDNLVHQNYVRGYPDEMDFVEHGTGDQVMHLNGNQALAYARIRHLGGDRERTERQRKVIMLLIDKVRDMKLAEVYELLDVILPMVHTNLSELECMSMLLNLTEYLDYEIVSIRMPMDGTWKNSMIDGRSVVEIENLDRCRRYLRSVIYS